MKVIYKYDIGESFYVPRGYQILCVNYQNLAPKIWILRDEIEYEGGEAFDEEYIQLEVVGTGQPFDDERRKYVGTYFDSGFVWHVFQVI